MVPLPLPLEIKVPIMWRLSSSSDPEALALADRHYSRRTPGSKTFTGVGREIVLVTTDCRAVWAVVYQRTPCKSGTGVSRGRNSIPDQKPHYVWRNMMFRNEGAGLSSDLIKEATERTFSEWLKRYGQLPSERLRTEIDVKAVRSSNPGFCYLCAGWERGPLLRGKLHLYAPRKL
jgi:hypothetical protein